MFSVHHISLSVVDINESIRFYEKLGFSVKLEWSADDDSVTIAHLKLGETFLELFCFKAQTPPPESMQTLGTDLPRVGIKHFGLRVESLADAERFVVEHGLATEVTPKRGRTDIDYFFIKDPSGNFIEFVQDDRAL